MLPDSGLLGSTVHLFVAEVDKLGNRDDGEAIDAIVALSFSELRELIAKGEVIDSFTIAAFTRALWRQRIREE
jgi:hypothetical protein